MAGKKNNLPLVIGAATALCVAAAVVAYPKGGSERVQDEAQVQNEVQVQDKAQVQNEAQVQDEVQVIADGEGLIIPVDEITSVAQFYPIEVDGTQMEVLAVKDTEGTIRTAFNTCQVCYSSGKGYYVQEEDMLVCQNCGNRFTIDQVEVESGSCNPWPIFEEDKTVTAENIEISYDFLRESKEIFSNWKTVSMQ